MGTPLRRRYWGFGRGPVFPEIGGNGALRRPGRRPPAARQARLCRTYGRAAADAARSRAREKRATNRATDLQLLHPRARGAFCFAVLARKAPGASEEGQPACTAGGWTLSVFRENWKTRVSGFWENLTNRRQAQGPPPRCHKFPPRARGSKKNILAVPDVSGSPPGASGPARMFFMGRAREGAVLDTKEEDPAPGADFSEFPRT